MLDQTLLAQLSSRLGWALVGNVFAERISKQSFEGVVRRWRHTSASRPKKLPSLLRHSRSRPRTHFSAPFTFTSPSKFFFVAGDIWWNVKCLANDRRRFCQWPRSDVNEPGWRKAEGEKHFLQSSVRWFIVACRCARRCQKLENNSNTRVH